MLKIGVLVSGRGTNLQAIIDRIEDGYLENCSVAVVVSNKKSAYALERAEKYGIPSEYLPRKGRTIEEYDRLIIRCLEDRDTGLVVLAGFTTIMGKDFTDRFRNRIINVHPALIPSFCGKGYYGIIPHRKALEYGVKITGATVHFVELETDAGPIILQKPVKVLDNDTPETLQRRVMEEGERKILPEAIRFISENRIRIEGRRVYINED